MVRIAVARRLDLTPAQIAQLARDQSRDVRLAVVHCEDHE
jgi:hypothetical protein